MSNSCGWTTKLQLSKMKLQLFNIQIRFCDKWKRKKPTTELQLLKTKLQLSHSKEKNTAFIG